ncbi:MAG: carbohydrate kinase [Acidimicrobiales bacterium]|nr:carbohydrate kinase [Acidimicrobiales bacterium]
MLAVDVGSTFAKAQRFDDRGQPVGPLTQRPASLGPAGCADLDRVVAVVDALVGAAVDGDGGPVDAVALSSAWHTLVGLDDGGGPTTELSTWLDGRAAAEAAELRSAVTDAADLHHRIGAPIHPSLPAARIRWFARHRPEAFAATRRWCSLPEVVLSRWSGRPVGPSLSIASASGLYDQRAGAWDDELVNLLSLPAGSLCAIEDAAPLSLGHDYGAKWPALAGVPIFNAIGDGACAVVGSRALAGGRAAFTVGTSAAVRVRSTRAQRWDRPLPDALFGYALDEDRPVVGAARSNAGNVVAWALDVLRVDRPDPVAEATQGRRPGGHLLDVDASLVAERSPRWPLVPMAALIGLRPTTAPLDVVQALVEDVALGIAEAVEAFEAWAGPQTLVLGGGASASAGWRRLLADVLGRPLRVPAEAQTTALGAALLAFERLGVAVPDESGDEEVVEPDGERAEAFARVRVDRAGTAFGASLGP